MSLHIAHALSGSQSMTQITKTMTSNIENSPHNATIPVSYLLHRALMGLGMFMSHSSTGFTSDTLSPNISPTCCSAGTVAVLQWLYTTVPYFLCGITTLSVLKGRSTVRDNSKISRSWGISSSHIAKVYLPGRCGYHLQNSITHVHTHNTHQHQEVWGQRSSDALYAGYMHAIDQH